MRDDDFQWPILMLPLGLGFVIGMLLGAISTSSTWRASAVKTGHAEWVADADGKAVFKWKEVKL